jgi:hypothetical protein
MEREAMLRSLQVRDSVRHVAYVEEQGRIAARRDSARAARPIPERDPRPPIGGRSIAAVPGDSCACRIQGTVELRSEGRLSRPLRVTVALRGLSGIRSTVELFMGSPRPFTLERVQCGSLSLEVTWNSGRRYRLEDPAAARELSCRDGRLLQPRLILVPE